MSAIPEVLTEEQFKTIAGNLYSKDVYDQLKNSDGKITRANLLQELKLEYNPSVDLKIIPWEQLMFDTSAEIGRGLFPLMSLILLIRHILALFYSFTCLLTNTGSFGNVYQALWVPRANSTTGSKAVAVKVMTRVAAGTLGRKYDDALTHSREEATRVLEIAKRYRQSFFLLLHPSYHCLTSSFNHHCSLFLCRGGEAVADAIIKVYGFAEGPLPAQITSKFKLEPGEEAFGVVMI